MIPAAFDYIAPRTLDEALAAIQEGGSEAKLLAGGHSLLPLVKLRLARPRLLIDISRIPGLNAITRAGGDLVIGALATHYQIETSELLRKHCPLLPQTAREIGDVQVRNRGTIGGSLAHADPSADWPAAALASDAQLIVRRKGGERRIAVHDFFTGPMTTAMTVDEILTEIRAPVPRRRSGSAYAKMAQQASGFAIVGVAVSLTLDSSGRCDQIRVALTGLAATPFRARAVEQKLAGQKLTPKLVESCVASIAEGIEPLEDLHANADFRAHLARVFAARAANQAARAAANS